MNIRNGRVPQQFRNLRRFCIQPYGPFTVGSFQEPELLKDFPSQVERWIIQQASPVWPANGHSTGTGCSVKCQHCICLVSISDITFLTCCKHKQKNLKSFDPCLSAKFVVPEAAGRPRWLLIAMRCNNVQAPEERLASFHGSTISLPRLQ